MMPKVKLGDLVTITGGGTPSKSDESFWNGEIPWMSVKDLRGNIVYNTTDTITPKGLANCASNLVKKGTLVMATRMAVGKVVYAGVDLAINQDLKALSLKPVLFHRYLFYQLISKQSYFENHSKGATVKGITLDVIKQLDIHLPPLEDQKKIAAILDAADDYRQKTKALIERYDQLTQSLFLDMFGDPVTNPKGWKKASLSTICDFSKTTIKPDEIQEGDAYLGLESIQKSTGKIIEKFTVAAGELKSNKFYFNENYILYGKLRPYLNKVAVPDFSGVCSTDIIPLKPRAEHSVKAFIVSLLRGEWFVSYADERSSGANLPRISPKVVQKYSSIFPPLELQKQFAERVVQIEKQKQQAEESLVKAEDLFNSLLQRAFKGELTN
jgi:type I restriction enzyme S subunit